MTEQVEKNLLDELTHISLSKSGLNELMRDYKEEFQEELDGQDVSIEDLQEYLGIRIVVDAAHNWQNDKKYQLLKEA